MIITHENEQYELNIKKAIQTGILTPTKKFNVDLSAEEIEVLKFIMGRIGGDPDTTPRKYVNSMYKKVCNIIDDNGLNYHNVTSGFEFDNQGGASNSLYFKKIS